MTTVRIFQAEGEITAFSISGHAGYASHGADIVCAGISAIAQTAAIGLTEVLHTKAQVDIDAKKGSLNLQLGPDAPPEAQIILRTMLAGLESIQAQYPEYIRINRNGGRIT